jgi:endonuclease VIII
MPEGPEVWREAQAIAHVLEGEPLTHIQIAWLKVGISANSFAGVRVSRVRPRGKAMTIAFSNGFSFVTHNQLYGEWRVAKQPPSHHRKALRLLFQTARGVAMLYSATDINWLPTKDVDRHPYIRKLGPDALDDSISVDMIAMRLLDKRFRNRSLASLLLDQSFVAGLGNYLRSDILFFARVRGNVKPAQCDDLEIEALAHAIIDMPRQSLRTRGITNNTSLADDLKREGWRFGRYRHWVFDREGEHCHVCASVIERDVVAGRNVFFCAVCQLTSSNAS